jgi:uncharacterized protein (TIGR02147 family)
MGKGNTQTAINISNELSEVSLKRPNIFEYSDCRKFLNDLIEFLRPTEGLTIRSLARQSDLSPAFVVLVISGKRPLSKKASEKILPNLKLRRDESVFFEKLRLADTEKNAELKSEAVLSLKKHRKYKMSSKQESDTFEYLRHWYHIAIKELSTHPDFQDDPKWIQENLSFKVPMKEIRSALKFLEKSEFLIKNKEGRLVPVDKRIYCKQKVLNQSIRSMHDQMLKLALKSIDEIDSSERIVLGVSVLVGDNQIQEIRDVIRRAQVEIAEIEEKFDEANDSSGKVYHVELAGFPMTHGKKKAKSR